MGGSSSKEASADKPSLTITSPTAVKIKYPVSRDPEPNIEPASPFSISKRQRTDDREQGRQIDFSEPVSDEGVEYEEDKESFKPNNFYREAKKFGPANFYKYTLDIVRIYNDKLFISIPGQPPTLNPTSAVKYFAGFFLQLQALTYNIMNNKRRIDKRSLWERTGASEQCKKIIGDTKEETTCWLCGFHKDELPPEILPAARTWDCEHLLPVSAALLFFDVPHSIEDFNKPIYDYSLNYEWAHSICNNFKSSFLFADLFVKDSSGKNTLTLLNSPQMNDRYIQLYLSELYTILKLQVDKDVWISHRQEIIKQRFGRLTSYIGEIRKREIPTLFSEFNIRDSRIKKIISSINSVYKNVLRKEMVKDYADKEIIDAFNKQRKEILWLNPTSFCKYPNWKNILTTLQKEGWIPEDLSKEIYSTCEIPLDKKPRIIGGDKGTLKLKKNIKRKRTYRNKNSNT